MKQVTILELYQGLSEIVNKYPYYKIYVTPTISADNPILINGGGLFRTKLVPKIQIDRDKRIAILLGEW